MLTELHIENFALIDKLTVTFAPGLNILTGETGAGKSIVIDAINVLLGERAGTDLVRSGATRALLQATFDVTDNPTLQEALVDLGIEPEDGLIILGREVAREGRNVARVNGRSCPVSVIRAVGDLLVDLHGQHEHQSLLREEHHRTFLDARGQADFQRQREEVTRLVHQRTALLDEWQSLQTDERERLRAIDLLSFQVQEIDSASLTPGEDEELAVERIRLANAERLHAAATAAYRLLYDGDEGRSVLDAIGEAEMQLTTLTRIDATLDPVVRALEAASLQIGEVCHELSAYQDQVQFDPERLEAVEERLTLISTLKRKYGETIDAILTYADEKRTELARFTHHDARREELRWEIDRLDAVLATRAEELSAARRELATSLAVGLQAELAHLGMPRAVFDVSFTRQPQADGLPVNGERVAVTPEGGIDVIAFHISANAGEPPKPLAKIASGGELSRIMLALKSLMARDTGVPTLIFDEIDTGIGGRTAEAVGEKLTQVARAAQVICVTHLAQLAFHADEHFLLEKAFIGDRTVSHMRALGEEERIEELARLQAGGRVSDAVRAHIRSVLDEIRAQRAGTLFPAS